LRVPFQDTEALWLPLHIETVFDAFAAAKDLPTLTDYPDENVFRTVADLETIDKPLAIFCGSIAWDAALIG
jgi:hypothetical protein